MNVLFIGPYRQPDEWGEMSRSIMKSMLSVDDISLTARPIFLSQAILNPESCDPDIFRCEANKQSDYDVVVQHCLPNFMLQDGRFKINVGITSMETKGNKEWTNNLELMDKILVCTEAEKDCVPKKLRDKVHVIGASVDLVETSVVAPNPRFSFYALAGNLETKVGILPLLQAYFSEFHLNETVSLVIQTPKVEFAQQMVQETAQTLGIYAKSLYPHVHIVESDPENSLHKNCHCLVDVSVTRGFKRDVAKALLYGNTPIVLQGSGMDEYVNLENGWVVDSTESILVCPDRPLVNVFTGKETCIIPDKLHLRKCMRDAYDNRAFRNSKSLKGKETASLFSIKKQGELIRGILQL
tara:strand:+ start:922 stop:1983 length:1062 start_codon:yes stop_codon:yes gene_type:complete